MLTLDPDFFVHTGDIEYYDKPEPYATNMELARFKWNRLYGLSNLSHFHNNVASYFIKDDHDTTCNDAWPGVNYGELTWQQGLDLFREQFPVKKDNYRTIRWGKDLQIWLVEGRDFRSPNTMPDGPEKTIWGKEQKEWFLRTFKESDATFRVLISPTAFVGPDRGGKNDNHANKGFTHEGDEIRNFRRLEKWTGRTRAPVSQGQGGLSGCHCQQRKQQAYLASDPLQCRRQSLQRGYQPSKVAIISCSVAAYWRGWRCVVF